MGELDLCSHERDAFLMRLCCCILANPNHAWSLQAV